MESLGAVDISLVSVDPKSCHVGVLPFLAWECDVDISGVSESTAREMIQAAFDAMQYAGTTKALQDNVTALSDESKVVEWYEYDGDAYHFKADVIVSDMNKRFGENLFAKMDATANKYKNVRSKFDGFNIMLRDADGKVEVAGAGTLSAKLANELSLDYNSFGAIDVATVCLMNVKTSNTIEVVYPQTDINIQGAGIWTI